MVINVIDNLQTVENHFYFLLQSFSKFFNYVSPDLMYCPPFLHNFMTMLYQKLYCYLLEVPPPPPPPDNLVTSVISICSFLFFYW